MAHHSPNALTANVFELEFPQSLGTFREYSDVQRLVDALADADFPVRNTMIVGTDVKLVERVTGRKSWGRVLLGGLMSGLWMGLFVGVLLGMFTDDWLSTLGSSVLMGGVFFTVWSAISHAFSGGQRDFTSMTATIPMQYELLVEHRHLMEAHRIVRERGLTLGAGAFGTPQHHSGPTDPSPHPSPTFGASPHDQSGPSSAASSDSAQSRPSYGQPAAVPHSTAQRPNGAPSGSNEAPHDRSWQTNPHGTPAGSDEASQDTSWQTNPRGRPSRNDEAPREHASEQSAESAQHSSPAAEDVPPASRRPTYGLPGDTQPPRTPPE